MDRRTEQLTNRIWLETEPLTDRSLVYNLIVRIGEGRMLRIGCSNQRNARALAAAFEKIEIELPNAISWIEASEAIDE